MPPRDPRPFVRARYELGRDDPARGFERLGPLRALALDARRRLPSPEKWLYRSGLSSAAGLTLPDVLGIGAQKAGTTWLHENLGRHPEVFVPERVKEVHYFDLQFQRPLREYAQVFAAGRDRVKVDVTPNYGKLRLARIRFVRSVMPDVRLVFLMRDPVLRHWSQALMDLVVRSGRRYEDVPEEEFSAHFESPRIQRNGHYTELIDRWLAVFPAERLFVGFVEEVRERPRELLGRLFRHIGVSDDVDWSRFPLEERIHEGPGVPLPAAYRARLAAIYAREIERLGARFGGPAASWGNP